MNPDLYQQMLAAMSATDSDAAPKLEDMLIELGNSNPRFQLIAQYMTARRQAEKEAELEDEDDLMESPALDRIPYETELENRQKNKARLGRMIANMKAEIEALRKERAQADEIYEINYTLAAALGLCNLCLGAQPDCELCHGKGGPGYMLPNRKLFSQYVMPANRRLRIESKVENASVKDKANHQLNSKKGEKNG